jgi:hypothetical protein
LASDEFKNEPRREPIATLQLKLISAEDQAPRALGGGGKEPPRIPLGIAPTAPTPGDEPSETGPAATRTLDLNKPLFLERGEANPFPAR